MNLVKSIEIIWSYFSLINWILFQGFFANWVYLLSSHLFEWLIFNYINANTIIFGFSAWDYLVNTAEDPSSTESTPLRICGHKVRIIYMYKDYVQKAICNCRIIWVSGLLTKRIEKF